MGQIYRSRHGEACSCGHAERPHGWETAEPIRNRNYSDPQGLSVRDVQGKNVKKAFSLLAHALIPLFLHPSFLQF